MKISNLIFILFILVYLIGSCRDASEGVLEFKDYYAEGTADTNHLEKGVWKFFNLDNHDLCEIGNFTFGLRDGLWQYYIPVRDSIFWSPFNNVNSTVRTNLPIFLISDYEDSNFVSFKHQDTSILLLLKIAYAKNVNFNPDNYNELIRREVAANSIKVNSEKYSLIKTTCNTTYNINRFNGVDTLHRNYELLTINGIIDSKLVEVTLRVGVQNIELGEIIFHSVVSNLFIDNSRFFDSNIDCEILRNKIVKRKKSISFGCNNPQ
jgi:hypothetical protein